MDAPPAGHHDPAMSTPEATTATRPPAAPHATAATSPRQVRVPC